MKSKLSIFIPFTALFIFLMTVLFIGLPNGSHQQGALPVAQAQDDSPIVVTVEVTREVTRVVTVVVTPTHTPLPPTATPLPLDLTVENDEFLGSEDALVKVVEFSDFRCGYCGRFYQTTFKELTSHYGDLIQFVYRDFPIFGDPSVLAALGSECAGDQGQFWEFHDLVFNSQTASPQVEITQDSLTSMAAELGLDVEEWNTCLASDDALNEVILDAQDAQAWGVTGTPTFFINGKALVGAQPIEVFYQIIDAELRAVGIEPPATN